MKFLVDILPILLFFFAYKLYDIYVATAVVILGSQYIGSKSVLQRMMAANITLPEPVWHRLNWIWVSFFTALGAINLYVAYHYDTETWVNFKLFGMMGLTILFIIAQGFYLSRYIKADEKN